MNITYKLTSIAYIESDFSEDELFISEINNISSSFNIKLLSFSDRNEFAVSCNEAGDNYASSMLFISNSNDSFKIAHSHNIACLAYVPKRDKFLHTAYAFEGFDELDLTFFDKVFKRFHRIPLVIAETNRCIIRELSLDDLDNLFALYSDSSITKYVEPLFDYDEEYEYEKNYIEYMYACCEYGMWLVFDKFSGKLIGRAGLEHRFYGTETELEMGYIISSAYQRQGYATEVCNAIIDYAKNNLEYDRINCLIDEDNIPSIKLIEKLNFKYVGRSDASGQEMNRYQLFLQ